MQSPPEPTHSEPPGDLARSTSSSRCSSARLPVASATTLPRAKRGPSSSRMAYFATAMRSHSDGSLSASVVPFPLETSAQKTEEHAEDQAAKRDNKAVAATRGTRRTNRRCSEASTPWRTPDKRRAGGDAGDAFLDASMQLLHLQDEARQRVRQLWVSVQRLRQENQLSDVGVDHLYTELAAVMKSLSAEKLEGAKHVKSGHLLLLQAPTTTAASDGSGGSSAFAAGSAGMKAFFGAKPSVQRVWCSLSEEQSKLEIVPVRESAGGTGGSSLFGAGSSSEAASPGGALGRFGLPTTASLLGMISDAFQEGPTRRSIRLQGCQVRKVPVRSSGSDPSSSTLDGGTADANSTTRTRDSRRFQLLVPCTTREATSDAGDATDKSLGLPAYESIVLEVPPSLPGYGGEEEEDAETQADDWVRALDRVCMFQLYRLEHVLRQAQDSGRYRETLARHFPVSVPLTWLRNRIDHADGGGSISRQVQQAQQRRSSRNLSMVQIIKDLERDKVLVDDQLFSAGSKIRTSVIHARGSDEDGDGDVEQDSVSEMVKYVVTKVLEFEKRSLGQRKAVKSTGATPPLVQPPTSPANRFSKTSEARALSFVERVLRGSSRTQSGGDIYDAISFFCQQESVTICPVSQDARPVQMRLVSDASSGVFQVEVQVCMRFKVVELTPTSPRDTVAALLAAADLVTGAMGPARLDNDGLHEWAVLEGTLSRHFTLGHLSTPGTVTIDYVRDGDVSTSSDA